MIGIPLVRHRQITRNRATLQFNQLPIKFDAIHRTQIIEWAPHPTLDNDSQEKFRKYAPCFLYAWILTVLMKFKFLSTVICLVMLVFSDWWKEARTFNVLVPTASNWGM